MIWIAVIGGCLLSVTAAAPTLSGESAAKQPDQPTAAKHNDFPVTVEKDAVTVEELLAALGERSGLKLVAGPSIRWDEVALRVHQRPVSRVMAEVEELLNAGWERGAQGSRTFDEDLRSRAYEEELRQRWFGGAADELQNYAALAQRPAEYYIRVKEALHGKVPQDRRLQGVVMEILTDPSRHAALQLLSTLSRAQLLALVSTADNQGYYVPWRGMTPVQQELALRVADGMATTPEARQWVQATGLGLVNLLWPGTNHPRIYEVFVGDVMRNSGNGITPRPTPTRGGIETRGAPYPPREGRSHRTAADQQRGQDDRTEPARERGYADLEKIPFPARGFRQRYPSNWLTVLPQLAERLSFALYSDHFPVPFIGVDATLYDAANEGPENPPILPLEGMSLAEGLDALCARYGRVWWRDGDALFFRSRTWFLDRLNQVPRPALLSLQKQLKSEGKLNRQGLDLLAGLSARQLSSIHLLAEQQLKRGLRWSNLEYRVYWLLRVYAALSDKQKERVLAAAGLPLPEMTPAQQRAYRDALLLCHAPGKLLGEPPSFHFEQAVLPGTPDQKLSLGELAFFLADPAVRLGERRDYWPRLAALYIPFPADKQEAEASERTR